MAFWLGFGPLQELESKLKAGISVILGTVPLYLIPDNGNCRVMPWSTAQKADWGIIMLTLGCKRWVFLAFSHSLFKIQTQRFI